ncbi:MAG: efflux RND transporter periplasmic adaptor subunit [Gemmatimonadaceae bacterium]|nr:efflux RND transporter periplasmic adaptor subunit [Gemmatimonadaceae bacterium]
MSSMSSRSSRFTALFSLFTLTACGGATGERATADGAANAPTTDSAAVLTLGSADLAVATRAEIGAGVTLSGPLEPRDAVVLRAQVNGTLAALRVNRGSPVGEGQRLATIRAAGVVSGAAGAKANVAAADANLAVARKQREAARTLFAAGAMSELDRQSAEAQYESAVAQAAAARAQSVSADEAAGYTAIIAPFRGVVSKRWRQDGESVKPGDEVLTVVDSRVLELAGQIGVADAARVRVGQSVAFTLDAFANDTFTGRVARVDPVADAGTRQVGVYVELKNPSGKIVGGQFARGRVAMGASSAVVVPATAIVRAGAGENQNADSTTTFVFVVSNERIVKRTVETGARDDGTGMVAILTGLAIGEQVVRTPTSAVVAGARVRFLNADRATPTSGAAPSAPAKE